MGFVGSVSSQAYLSSNREDALLLEPLCRSAGSAMFIALGRGKSTSSFRSEIICPLLEKARKIRKVCPVSINIAREMTLESLQHPFSFCGNLDKLLEAFYPGLFLLRADNSPGHELSIVRRLLLKEFPCFFVAL